MRVSEQTIRRWARAWRAGGFEALVPAPARVTPRTPAEVLALAVALKRENPARTAVQVTRILRAQTGWAPSDRTLQRHFAPAWSSAGSWKAARRYSAGSRPSRCNEIVDRRRPARPGDRRPQNVSVRVPRRPFPGGDGRPVRLQRGHRPPRRRAAPGTGLPRCPRIGLRGQRSRRSSIRGCCGRARAWASGSSTPRPARPQGRGKIERFFRTVRDQFLVEITEAAPPSAITGLAELNRLFTAWVETVYHRRVHSETGAPPLRRWQARRATRCRCPTPAQLAEAFLWCEFRTVTKTATVSLHGNTYQVDELLAGRKVELVFDPFDLDDIEVRYGGRASARRPRSPSAATPTPKPAPSSPRRSRPRRPGSTTWT